MMVMMMFTGGSAVNSLCGAHQTLPMGYQLPGQYSIC